MEVEVKLALIGFYKHIVCCFCVFTAGKFNQSGLKKPILAISDEKGWILKYFANILARKLNQNSQQNFFLSLKIKLTVLLLIIFTNLSKIDEIVGIIPEHVNKNNIIHCLLFT